jgi:hypothetical protein
MPTANIVGYLLKIKFNYIDISYRENTKVVGFLDKKVLFQTRLYNSQKEFLFSIMTAIYNGGYGCNPDFGR